MSAPSHPHDSLTHQLDPWQQTGYSRVCAPYTLYNTAFFSAPCAVFPTFVHPHAPKKKKEKKNSGQTSWCRTIGCMLHKHTDTTIPLSTHVPSPIMHFELMNVKVLPRVAMRSPFSCIIHAEISFIKMENILWT